MSKTVRIECRGAGELAIDLLTPLQGDLKTLTKENYEKLRKEILLDGFSSPFYIWEDTEDGKTYILDGHQRYHTLRQMRDKEGYKLPQFPVVMIEAEDKKQAVHKLLAFASQYGKMEDQGLYELIETHGIELDDMASSFSFPEINFENFGENFYADQMNPEVEEFEEAKQGDDKVESVVTASALPESQIRQVQLFYDGNGHMEFMKMAAILQINLKIDNLSELIIEVLREKYKSVEPD